MNSYQRSAVLRKYTINEDYFTEPNLVNSYWAGFIAADGNINKKTRALTIKLQRRDISMLERLRADCGSNAPIRISEYNGFPAATLTLCNRKITDDLAIYFNIKTAKTFTLKPPFLSMQNNYAYLIGFIDGDGCISYQKRNVGASTLKLQLVGTEDIMHWSKSLLNTCIFRETNYRKSEVHRLKNVYTYQIAGRRAEDALSFLNSIPVQKMDRKWKLVPEILYDESTQLSLW